VGSQVTDSRRAHKSGIDYSHWRKYPVAFFWVKKQGDVLLFPLRSCTQNHFRPDDLRPYVFFIVETPNDEYAGQTSVMLQTKSYEVNLNIRCGNSSPADIIFTGTPQGVILDYPPEKQVWLKPGDQVTTSIEKLGEHRFTLA
jgi:hypothetical protein